MAKIVFLIDRLPPHADPIAEFAYDLICGLADQNHQIRLLSTYRPGEALPESHPRIEFLRPFRTWSLLELARVLPLLMEYQPDIIHILQPRAEAARGFTSALNFLPSLSSSLIKARLVTTIFEIEASDVKTLKWILASSHAVTTATASQLELTRKLTNMRRNPPLFELLPISSAFVKNSSLSAPHIPDALQSFFSRRDLVVVLPGDVSHHHSEVIAQLESVLGDLPQSQILFAGGWGKTSIHERHLRMQRWENLLIGDRILISGPLNLDLERWCLNHAALVVLAGMPIESSQLARLIREAMHAAVPMLLTNAQVTHEKLSFESGENCVAISTFSSIAKATSKILLDPEARERIQSVLRQTSNIQAVDLPANAMNRLYTKVLEGL